MTPFAVNQWIRWCISRIPTQSTKVSPMSPGEELLIDFWYTGFPVSQVYHRQIFPVTRNLFSCMLENKKRK